MTLIHVNSTKVAKELVCREAARYGRPEMESTKQ